MDDNGQKLQDEAQEPEQTENTTSVRSEIYDWLLCIVTAIVACVLVFTFAVRLVGVVGTSMVPTLHDGDYVVTSKLFYKPKQGDVVILRKQIFDERAIVKRVIAVAGQTVDIDFNEGVVYVDGQALQEDYVNAPTFRELDFKDPVTVPENCVFVLGDNRNESLDSRRSTLGCVDTRYIIGRGYLVLLPFRDFKFLT
ncbi:MAG: signal peptidase I [Oscillospiraceae bacterium]|nr:signal peptidase I [Oscillospiraceae bacterium]